MKASNFVVDGREYKLGSKFLSGCDVAPRHLLTENIAQQKSLSRTLLTRLGVLKNAAQPVLEYREQDQRKFNQLLSRSVDSARPETETRTVEVATEQPGYHPHSTYEEAQAPRLTK